MSFVGVGMSLSTTSLNKFTYRRVLFRIRATISRFLGSQSLSGMMERATHVSDVLQLNDQHLLITVRNVLLLRD
jgi:hypothetical protein